MGPGLSITLTRTVLSTDPFSFSTCTLYLPVSDRLDLVRLRVVILAAVSILILVSLIGLSLNVHLTLGSGAAVKGNSRTVPVPALITISSLYWSLVNLGAAV